MPDFYEYEDPLEFIAKKEDFDTKKKNMYIRNTIN